MSGCQGGNCGDGYGDDSSHFSADYDGHHDCDIYGHGYDYGDDGSDQHGHIYGDYDRGPHYSPDGSLPGGVDQGQGK